jgi:ketosteroid isomerase-like protein
VDSRQGREPLSTNLNLVRSIYAAWECGDFSSTDWAHAEIEFVITEGAEAGRWRGLGAVAGAFRDYLGTWEGFRAEAEEYHRLGDERVLVLDRFSGRDKASGVELGEMSANGATLFELASGRVIKIVTYLDRKRALADVGLARQVSSPGS